MQILNGLYRHMEEIPYFLITLMGIDPEIISNWISEYQKDDKHPPSLQLKFLRR